MSAFVVHPETMHIVAPLFCHPGASCEQIDHKGRELFRLNISAVSVLYGGTPDFELADSYRYSPREKPPAPVVLKQLQCFLYQCEESKTLMSSPLYLQGREIELQLLREVAALNPVYDSAPWGTESKIRDTKTRADYETLGRAVARLVANPNNEPRTVAGMARRYAENSGVNLEEIQRDQKTAALVRECSDALRGVSVMINTGALASFDGEPWLRRVVEVLAKFDGETPAPAKWSNLERFGNAARLLMEENPANIAEQLRAAAEDLGLLPNPDATAPDFFDCVSEFEESQPID